MATGERATRFIIVGFGFVVVVIVIVIMDVDVVAIVRRCFVGQAPVDEIGGVPTMDTEPDVRVEVSMVN